MTVELSLDETMDLTVLQHVLRGAKTDAAVASRVGGGETGRIAVDKSLRRLEFFGAVMRLSACAAPKTLMFGAVVAVYSELTLTQIGQNLLTRHGIKC